MRRRTLLLALGGAAAFVVLPVRGRTTSLFAQGTSGRATTDTTVRRPPSPIARLIAHKQQLGLTDAQVNRLTQIEQQLDARNRVLRDSIRATLGLRQGTRPAPWDTTPAQREAWRAKMRALEPVRRQMRDNARSAMEQVRSTLTAEQRTQVRRAMRRAIRRMRWQRWAFAHRRGRGRPGWGRPWGGPRRGWGGGHMRWGRSPAWGPGPSGRAWGPGPVGRTWRRQPRGPRGWGRDSTRGTPADSARAPAPRKP